MSHIYTGAITSQGAQYIAYEQQEITLETIVALCQEPSFVIDVYIAYDCDVHFGNLFAKLVDFLYKVLLLPLFQITMPLTTECRPPIKIQ